METSENKFTVGQMAELCSMTAKQLRYYDNNGILCPAIRDPETGYRYYTEQQIQEVLMIQELKELGFPLKSISALLNHRGLDSLRRELMENLDRVRQELEAARVKYDRTVDILMRVMAFSSPSSGLVSQDACGPIQLVTTTERPIVFTRYVSYWNAEKLFIQRRGELLRLAEQQNLKPTGANMAIFHSNYLKQFSSLPEDSEGDLEVCIGVCNPTPSPHCRILPSFQAVSCIFLGDYRFMKPCYEKMEAWAAQRGLSLSGASLEEYLVGATMTNRPEDYVTRLFLPLRGFSL